MMVMSAVATAMLASGAPANVAYEPLIEGRDAVAVEQLRETGEAAAEDPAVLINLGIAYARQGRTQEARAMFEAVMKSSDRMVLETATGEWKDSRHLARLALKMLDRGDLRTERMAAR